MENDMIKSILYKPGVYSGGRSRQISVSCLASSLVYTVGSGQQRLHSETLSLEKQA